MIKQKGATLFKCNIDGATYSVCATAHALMRMEDRRVSTAAIHKMISQLSPTLIQGLLLIDRYIALVNTIDSVTALMGFADGKIIIITVINTSKYYPRTDTLVLAV